MRRTSLLLLALALALFGLVTGCGGAPKAAEARSPGYYGGGAGAAAPAMAPQAEMADAEKSEVAVSAREEPPPAPVANGAPSPGRIAQAPPPPPVPGQPKPPPIASDAHSGAMLIYTAALNLGVYQVEARMNDVEKIARDVGGYLALRNDQQITVRIPRAQFDAAVARIEKLGDVLHRNISAQDVTDEFVDLETRLKNARAMRDRLEILLKQAAVKDALEIEKELGRITGEIERMEGRLKLLRDKIAFSTITVTFQPLDNQTVRDSSILPFPWLSDIGLGPLLNVHP